MQRKLKEAFKKVHQENMKVPGGDADESKVKKKASKADKEQSRYYASHCMLCKTPFEDEKGVTRQNFTLDKMIDDENDISQVLKVSKTTVVKFKIT